ncbi:hypothetical protein NPIL_245631 [Nephila pilipes]|uniref:Uncharacterized protein n=1 Tax=Nephila pilipes TaxID=299642 RepID=A0A8X6NVX4_NEPPI|nr:hypothetical protein NPIL_245631 [Nephila pilipes]
MQVLLIDVAIKEEKEYKSNPLKRNPNARGGPQNDRDLTKRTRGPNWSLQESSERDGRLGGTSVLNYPQDCRLAGKTFCRAVTSG